MKPNHWLDHASAVWERPLSSARSIKHRKVSTLLNWICGKSTREHYLQ